MAARGVRTGGVPPGTTQVIGLKEFRAALKTSTTAFPFELTRVHKTIANQGAARARGVAAGMGGQQAKYARSIKGRATQTRASIGVFAGKTNPGAGAAFWGTKRRYGWYNWRRYQGTGAPQYKPWVGNTWQVAQFGQGPYAINPALAAYLPELLNEYGKMIDRLSARAFPEPGSTGLSGDVIVIPTVGGANPAL